MKKEIIATAIILLFAVTPAFAAKPLEKNENVNSIQGSVKSQEVKNNNDKQKNESNSLSQGKSSNTQSVPSVSPLEVFGEEELKNDSLVSQQEECDPASEWRNHGEYVSCVAHLHLGGNVTSAAARSDVGKKVHSNVSPTATPSPTPITSAVLTLEQGFAPLQSLETFVGKVFGFLKRLI